MPVTQPPTGQIEISDSNNVSEQFINGPFNIMNAGGMVAHYPHDSTAKPK
jgi:hypothetical protein